MLILFIFLFWISLKIESSIALHNTREPGNETIDLGEKEYTNSTACYDEYQSLLLDCSILIISGGEFISNQFIPGCQLNNDKFYFRLTQWHQKLVLNCYKIISNKDEEEEGNPCDIQSLFISELQYC